MTTPISGGMTNMYVTPSSQNALTDEQVQGLDDLMSNYDTDDLTDADAQTIVTSISELGITPGKELASALAGYGVDARELGDQAGVGRPEGPPPGGGKGGKGGGEDATAGVDDAALSVLESLLEALEDSEETDETTETDFSALLQSELEAAGLDPTQSIMDIIL